MRFFRSEHFSIGLGSVKDVENCYVFSYLCHNIKIGYLNSQGLSGKHVEQRKSFGTHYYEGEVKHQSC